MILIVDIDGTLSDYSHRLHIINKDPITKEDFRAFLEPSLVEKDAPYPKAKEGLSVLMHRACTTFFITSRQEYLRDVTTAWLRKHMGVVVEPHRLLMRETGTFGLATEHKVDLLIRHVIPVSWNSPDLIKMFIDDDPYVLSLYSKYGIALKAPDCWSLLLHQQPDKPEEILSR
jgi:hypothetical protein